jgi:hypothetical protein
MKKLKFGNHIDFFSKIFMKSSKKGKEKEENKEKDEIILLSYPLLEKVEENY